MNKDEFKLRGGNRSCRTGPCLNRSDLVEKTKAD